jgi:hypothetical protein
MKRNNVVWSGFIGLGGVVAMALAAPLELSRQSIDSGGMMASTGGTIAMSSTIGQPDAGWMVGGSLELTGGFWFALSEGDCNEDGGVDRGDHAQFTLCALGPSNPIVELECGCFDMDESETVDLLDFALIQTTFVGP